MNGEISSAQIQHEVREATSLRIIPEVLADNVIARPVTSKPSAVTQMESFVVP